MLGGEQEGLAGTMKQTARHDLLVRLPWTLHLVPRADVDPQFREAAEEGLKQESKEELEVGTSCSFDVPRVHLWQCGNELDPFTSKERSAAVGSCWCNLLAHYSGAGQGREGAAWPALRLPMARQTAEAQCLGLPS